MRWDALFTDLESQLHAALITQQESEIRDRTRSEQARLTLTQRLMGQVGRQLGVATRGGRTIVGLLTNVGAGWVALVVDGRSVVLPLDALQVLRGLDRGVGQPLTGVGARLGLGSALRRLSRDRAAVTLWIGAPVAHHTGVIERVGVDFLEFGPASPGDDRRPAARREVMTIPFGSIDSIESARSTE